MLDLDDPRWSDLEGGYRLPCDPRDALRKLEAGISIDVAWRELWEELHHQGDVATASYAALPHLARVEAARLTPDWNTYALAVIIELARKGGHNPEIPAFLAEPYKAGWQLLFRLALKALPSAQDDMLTRSLLAVLAIGKQQISIAEMCLLTDDERAALLPR